MKKSIDILVVFRILFGLTLCYGMFISYWKGEIETRFTEPTFFFHYEGFSWLPYIGDTAIYIVYIILGIAAIAISIGFLFRIMVFIFFVGFTYLHLLDATNYINHYYLISIWCLFLLIAPAHHYFSIDSYLGWVAANRYIDGFYYNIFKLQIAIVYTFAGLAKLNYDWIINAMPLKIWLLQSTNFPVLGGLFHYDMVHYLFSWGGAFYDLTIAWWLLYPITRKYAYIVVLVFHILTGLLFDIGLFPILMPIGTLLFFDELILFKLDNNAPNVPINIPKSYTKVFFFAFFMVQLAFPLRSYVYYSNNIWTEEGYRWSWKVMLVEKEGYAQFYVQDTIRHKTYTVSNEEFLSPFQTKRMATQIHHIWQYANLIGDVYKERFHIISPIVTADIFVTMNGRRSKRFVNNFVNLYQYNGNIYKKPFILEYDFSN